MAEAIVEHDYSAKQPDELTIKKGDVIKEVVRKQEGWCEGLLDGKRGLFPDNFVVIVQVKMRSNLNSTRRCRAIYSYKQEHEDELTLNVGDVIEVVGEEEEGWWQGRLNGKVGVFPSNFVEDIPMTITSSKEEINGKEETSNTENVPPVREEVKVAKIYCEVKYGYQAQNSDELTLKEGDIVTLISKDGQDAGWWRGELDGKVGVFPDNFVVVVEKQEADEKVERRTHVMKPTNIASQRRSQEIKPLKVESSPPPSIANVPPAVPNKKPSIPFKKSPSGTNTSIFSSLTKKIADTIDGGASSKSVRINNDVDLSANKEESYHAFDNIERNPVLQDPRATRVKGPTRRPPSVALKEGEGIINGNSDYGSLEDSGLADEEHTREIKPRSIDVPKPPWLDEMSKKMSNKRTSTSPVVASERGSRLEASTASIDEAKSTEISPVDMSKSMPPTVFAQTRSKIDVKPEKPEKPEIKPPKTPPNELERGNSMDKVVLRSKPVGNIRPQTIEAPGRPATKTSPTVHRNASPSSSISPSPSPIAMGKPPIADRSSMEVISSRHFNELSERMSTLEAELQRQREEFTAMIDDLKGRLQVEADMRMLLQVEFEKLQAQTQS